MSSVKSVNKHHPQVVIIGAGPGGLTLARLLSQQGMSCKVFEAEASPQSRVQGGMLDIHQATGQEALKRAGLHQAFLDKVHAGGQAARIVDSDGKVLFAEEDDGSEVRPEIKRGDLRQLLLDALPTDTVQWGYKVEVVSRLENNRHRVTFGNGDSVECELLVGADGAWSKVRKLLSDASPAYSGTMFIESFLLNCEQAHAQTTVCVGSGALYALQPFKGITAHREPGNVLHGYIAIKKPLDWLEDKADDQPQLQAALLAEFDGWAEPLTAFIQHNDLPLVVRPIYALPDNHQWQHQAGITLLGDAAHLMVPSGEGVNLAMQDAMLLATAIRQHPQALDEALRQYESDMFVRNQVAYQDAEEIFRLCYGESAPHGLLAFFTQS